MKILICSPTYDGSLRVEYVRSIMALTDELRSRDIAFQLVIENATILHIMRSVMASMALIDSEVTHLLFIDTDMGFSADAIFKLLASGKDVAGCASPFRTIAYDEEVPRAGETYRRSIASKLNYAVTFAPGTTNVDIKEGFCEVATIGTGILMISRVALEMMRARGKLNIFGATMPYTQWYAGEQYYGFFEHLQKDGLYYSEDYSFCMRWTQNCGGKIYALVTEEILHVGPLPVIGRYIDKLKTGRL